MHRRTRALVLGTTLALLAAGCGDDDPDDNGAADVVPSDDGSPADTVTADTTGGGDGGSDSSCPEETLLSATTETSFEGDVEVLAPDTAFPSAHFTLDLDGSGYGPVLSGVLSTDPAEDVEALTHADPPAPQGDVRRVEVLLEGPPEGATEFPLGTYDVTFADGTVDSTEETGLAQLDVQADGSSRQARNFTEVELTYVGDGVICGELRRVDRSDETSQAPTYVEGPFVADYSERP